MKKTFKFNIAALLIAAFTLSACGDYLDKLPDDRASLDSKEKVGQFLVSAYSGRTQAFLFEMASDNVTDNGSQYASSAAQDKIYRFQDDPYTSNDDPLSQWQSLYTAVATANEALQAIGKLGGPEAMPGEYAEALLCRAYGMYTLSTIFCMAYNKDSADVYLGLPYPLEPEQDPTAQYSRGTLGELYGHINDDIEAALPYLSDDHLTTPKYHFNRNAAYAFAARFNLFYGNYQKAIEYASRVLGANPASMLRDWTTLPDLAGVDDIENAYLNSSLNCNLMLQTSYSIAGRMIYSSGYRRYAHNMEMITYETIWPEMPWGARGTRNNTLYMALMQYGSDQQVYCPKQAEMFEYTDKLGGTGYAHVVIPVFTGDETLLVRAEAEALSNDSTAAVRDINYWINSHCATSRGSFTRPSTLTMAAINQFYNSLGYAQVNPGSELFRSVKKTLHPQGFTVEPGNMENLVQLILQMRRIDGENDGSRLIDLKRYGIEYAHKLDGEPAIIIHAGDKRLAFQLPDDAINNGLEPNPR